MWAKSISILILSILSLALLLPPEAMAGERRQHGSVNTVVVRPHYWGGWGDPFWGGYFAPNYYVPDYRGKIKLKGFSDNDQIYLNGAYAGTIDDMDSLRLDPGRYSISIKSNGRDLVSRDVYVVTGKTIEIRGNQID